jgi:uncharacterized membrane-anchored protein
MSETTFQSTPPTSRPAWWDCGFAWLRGHERGVLLAAAAFHLAVLTTMTVTHAVPRLTGDTVLLRVVPVDPRDLFRGDYVILQYEFSRPAPGMIPGLGDLRNEEGRTVYVSLVPEEDGEHWRAAGVSLERPAQGRFIRGRIAEWGRLAFGIEAYFVQEGRGREYERAILSGQASAEVALTADGTAKLRGLRIE